MKIKTTGKGTDGGHGLVQHMPENSMMNKYYDELQKSGGYDSQGHPTKTGKQGMETADMKKDPSKNAGKYEATSQKRNKGAQAVSAKRKDAHKVKGN